MPYADELRESVRCLGRWAELPFFSDQPSPFDRVCRRLEGMTNVWPAADCTFAALRLCPPDDVRVVLLGKDPYPNPEHATGLAFSVRRETCPLPLTLRNISEEMRCDLGFNLKHGDVTNWARQGVLLLNSVLTKSNPAERGWDRLITDVFCLLRNQAHARNIFRVFWGTKSLAPHWLNEDQILKTYHPNHLKSQRLDPQFFFFGSKPFSKINSFFNQRNLPLICWQVPA